MHPQKRKAGPGEAVKKSVYRANGFLDAPFFKPRRGISPLDPRPQKSRPRVPRPPHELAKKTKTDRFRDSPKILYPSGRNRKMEICWKINFRSSFSRMFQFNTRTARWVPHVIVKRLLESPNRKKKQR
jgi:hypothetical protein